MLAVESSPSAAMAYSCGPLSFNHTDTLLTLHGSESSLDFDHHDEATEPVYKNNNNNKKKDSTTRTPTSTKPTCQESSIAARMPQEELSSSRPSTVTNNKRKKKRRRSLKSSANGQKKLKKTKKTVRFSPILQVRTYSIVLGDHPVCEDGLAIELGWDFEDSKDTCYQQQYKPKSPKWRRLLPNYPKPPALRSSSSPPRLLSSVERKNRLLEVGGCSVIEIKLRQFQAQILLQVQSILDENRDQALVRTPPFTRDTGSKNNTNNNRALYAAMA